MENTHPGAGGMQHTDESGLVYIVITQAGKKGIRCADANDAARVFHAANEEQRPFVMLSKGTNTWVVASTRRSADGAYARQLAHHAIDRGALSRAFEELGAGYVTGFHNEQSSSMSNA
jgi:hypothetical protein